MPRVLFTNDNRVVTIFSSRDFEEMIDKQMGKDCADYYHQQIWMLSDYIRELLKGCYDPYIRENMERVLKEYGY